MSAVIGALRVELQAGIAQFVNDMGKASNSVARFQTDFKRIASGLAAGFGASQVLSFGNAVLQSAASLSEQAQKIGVSVEAMQAYRIAFQQSGSTAQAADEQLKRLTRTIGQAETGSKTAIAAFDAIGISVEKISKANPDERLSMVARGLLSIADPAKRAAAEVALFGKSGQEIESVLTSLVPGIDNLKKKFDGLIVKGEIAARADEMADRLAAAGTTIKTALTPVIVNLTEAFANLVASMAGIDPGIRPLEEMHAAFEATAKSEGDTFLGRKAKEKAEEFRLAISQRKARAANIPFARPGQAMSGGGAGGAAELPAVVGGGAKSAASGDIAQNRLITDLASQQEERNRISADGIAAEIERRKTLTEFLIQNETDLTENIRDQVSQRTDLILAGEEERLAGEENAARYRQAVVDDTWNRVIGLAYSKNKELKAIGKAAAIAQATMDGYSAVMRAHATIPPPFNWAAAGLVAAAAAANVAAIAGMEKGGRITAGTPYIVGEKRPELFVPDTSGRILPEVPQGSRGGDIHVHQTIQIMPDANQIYRAQIEKDLPRIASVTISALQQAQRRGIV